MSGPRVGAQIDDVIVEETLGDRQAFKGRIENFDAVVENGEFHRLKAEPAGEAGMLIVDQAKHQIAAVPEIERRATAISVARAAAVGGIIRAQNCGRRTPRRAAPAGRWRHCSRRRSGSRNRPCRGGRSRRHKPSGRG